MATTPASPAFSPTCAQPSWLSNCTGAVDRAQGYIRNTLPGSLAALYASIRAKAPNAKVVVVGYPRIFNGTDCNLLTWFSGSEMVRAEPDRRPARHHHRGGRPVGEVRVRHSGPGVRRPRRLRTGAEWINGLSAPITESFHPNRGGQASGYTPLVSPALVGAPVAVTPSVLQKAAASAERLAAQQRSYAGLDATITPKRFVAPVLPSGSVTAAGRS